MRGRSQVRRGAGVACGRREREGDGGGRGKVTAPRAQPHQVWPTECRLVERMLHSFTHHQWDHSYIHSPQIPSCPSGCTLRRMQKGGEVFHTHDLGEHKCCPHFLPSSPSLSRSTCRRMHFGGRLSCPAFTTCLHTHQPRASAPQPLCHAHHARAGPHRGGCDVGDNDCVGALLQAGLHRGLILKHVQPTPVWKRYGGRV